MGMDGKVMKNNYAWNWGSEAKVSYAKDSEAQATYKKALLAWVNTLLNQEYCEVCKLYVSITAKGHQCGKVKGKPQLELL